MQGDMKIGFDWNNVTPYFIRGPLRAKVDRKGNYSWRKTLFDGDLEGPPGAVTLPGSGLTVYTEQRHVKPHIMFHEGVHVWQWRFSGNHFNRMLFFKNTIFKYYFKRGFRYPNFPWETGKYGAYDITDKGKSR